jgi:hypothetical protein
VEKASNGGFIVNIKYPLSLKVSFWLIADVFLIFYLHTSALGITIVK